MFGRIRYGEGTAKGAYRSGGTQLSGEAVGHLGFTGTSMWLDPTHQFFVILLTNSVHPDATSKQGDKIRQVRPAVADAAFKLSGSSTSDKL